MTDTKTTTPDSQADTKDGDEKIDWFAEFRGLAILVLAVLMFNSLVAKQFYIPSTSMMPGLQVGDRLVVSRYPYGWSWASASFFLLPRGEWRVMGSTPEYGDVVIPVHPEENVEYIKRVVALPGDTIEVQDGRIILNGEMVAREQVPDVRIPYDPDLMCENGPCLSNFSNFLKTDADGGQYYSIPAYRETLPNGASFLIFDYRNQSFDNFGPLVVPEDHVFVMGDNRDDSADSRASVPEQGLGGPIPLENIGGRAEFITFSLDGTASWNPLSWIPALRGDRAWTTLRPPLVEQSGEVSPTPAATSAQ